MKIWPTAMPHALGIGVAIVVVVAFVERIVLIPGVVMAELRLLDETVIETLDEALDKIVVDGVELKEVKFMLDDEVLHELVLEEMLNKVLEIVVDEVLKKEVDEVVFGRVVIPVVVVIGMLPDGVMLVPGLGAIAVTCVVIRPGLQESPEPVLAMVNVVIVRTVVVVVVVIVAAGLRQGSARRSKKPLRIRAQIVAASSRETIMKNLLFRASNWRQRSGILT